MANDEEDIPAVYHLDREALFRCLESEDADMRARAVLHLDGRFKQYPDLVERLLPLLADPDEFVRGYAINAMGSIGPQASKAVHVLRNQLQEGPHYLRLTAHRAIQQICPDDESPQPQWTGVGPYPCPYDWLFRKNDRAPELNLYQIAFPTLRPLVLRILYADGQRVALETEDGRVMNLVTRWVGDWGTRTVDAPVLSRCVRRVNSMRVMVYFQKLYGKPPANALREFVSRNEKEGWIFQDVTDSIGIDLETSELFLTHYAAGFCTKDL